MSTPIYILRRIISAIPLLIIVSILSFAIIRMNIFIESINVNFFLFFILGIIVSFFIGKIKTIKILFTLSLVPIILFSYYLSEFNIFPFDMFFKNNLAYILNFLFFILFFLLYWMQSYINKKKQFSQIILMISILVFSISISFKFPFEIPIHPIVLKSGDPLADLRFNPAISSITLQAEEKRLGLDKPWHVQYIFWLRGLFHGDLGITQQNEPVISAIKTPMLNTLLLSLSTLFFTWFIAIPLGIWAALNKNNLIDKFLSIFTSCGMSTPSFVLAVLGLLVVLKFQFLPIGGLTSINFYELNVLEKVVDVIKHLILPTFILTVISIAGLQRQMRANLLDVLRQEYIKTAIAKGLPFEKIIYKHALRNAINPLITIFGFEFASLLSGAALTETVLAYPGLGALTLEAARKLDINLTMTTLLIGAVMLVVGNLISDLLLKFADPRIKYEVS